MMTLRLPASRLPRRRLGGFTMTELALCIAVVSVALVAIIGVLPTGLNVQRQNREDTIVTEDGKVLLNALRTGSVSSANLLTNFDFILWERYPVNNLGQPGATPTFRRSYRTALWTDTAKLTALGYSSPILLTNAAQIVALMTAPRYVTVGNSDFQNVVRAQVRAISGALTEKPIAPFPNGAGAGPDGLTLDQRTEFSFRYLVTPELTPVAIAPTANSLSQAVATAQQIHELSLTIQWPVALRFDQTVEKLRVGHNRRVYRTQVFGQLMDLDSQDVGHLGAAGLGLKHFTPNSL